MFRAGRGNDPIEVVFYVGDGFTIVPFINALDPLRIANVLSGRTLFRTRLVSDDGQPVRAINGMVFEVDGSVSDARQASNVVLFIGFDPVMHLPEPLAIWMRRLVVQGCHLGAAGAGALFLAEAGLLDGYNATIHWRYRESFHERYASVQLSDNLFEIDRDRFTCAGGTAAMDMMLSAIATHFGHALATEVADLYIEDEVRDVRGNRTIMRRSRFGAQNPTLSRVVQLMEANVEHPLRVADLARHAKLSQRQIGRIFHDHYRQSPVQYYVRIRMEFGRRLIQQTNMPITEVAFASGFCSPEHFSRRYRALFETSPSQDRHRCRKSPGGPKIRD
jgi:transcriptional regulator GlxA family with amidase domain